MPLPQKNPQNEPKEDAYPIRINKYLADKGYSTRRGGDVLVEKGQVTINGKKAHLGEFVRKGDVVAVSGSNASTKEYTYLAYHKPKGVITHSPQDGEKSIAQSIRGIKGSITNDVFPIGRLDKNSHGLILLTNDGRITDRLLSPKYDHEKEYVVEVSENISPAFVRALEHGVRIDGVMTKPCIAEKMDSRVFRIVLTEGRKHQIKRMCDALHKTVSDLKRVRIMNIELGKLPPNSYRHITGRELETLLKSLNMPTL